MSPESSPFTPGQPVPIEFFVGRQKEIEQLRSLVRSSLGGRMRIGFVTGERGIGKSSLVSFVRHLCEREDEIAGAHVFLGGVSELPEMVRRIFDRLLKDSLEKPWYERVFEFFGSRVSKVGLFGVTVELRLTQEELAAIVNNFVVSLRKLVENLRKQRRGLLLILDDINGLAGSAQVASWLKSTIDEVATGQQKVPVCILIVGLEERRQAMLKHQPSLARVFDLVPIDPWTPQETRDFFVQTFGSQSVTIDPEALESMVQFAGGLPVLAHEIGDAVWRSSGDNVVTPESALNGIVTAAKIIGNKFLEPSVLQAIHGPRYRSVLRKFPRLGHTFKRSDLIKQLSTEEKKVVDNFLGKMKKLGVILPNGESGQGAYQFANQLHYLYFVLEPLKAKKPRA